MRVVMLACALLALAAPGASAEPQYGSMKGASLGQGASLNGAQPFPATNDWNRDRKSVV